jgi:hypothetical protein
MSSQCNMAVSRVWKFFFLHYDLTFRIFPIYVISALAPVTHTEVLHYYYRILHVSSFE